MTLTLENPISNTAHIEIDTTDSPHGFKMTELGLIPEDWDFKCLGDICWVNQGLQIAIEKRLKHKINNSKAYITIQFLNNGKEAEYVNDYSPSVCCIKEDILMTRTGNTGVVVTGVDGVFHNNFFKINYNKKFVDRSYLTYYLKSDKTQKIILCKAGTSTIPDLNHNDFYSILMPLPNLMQQRAIAAALSDIDSLINNLDLLIAKKRNIKLATMQQLLTGKQRLPGFKEDWKLRRIGEIFEFLSTANNPRSDLSDHGEIGYIHYGDIHGSSFSFFNCSKKSMPYIDQIKVRNLPYLEVGDLVIADASEDYEGIGKSIEILQLNNKKIVAGLHTFLLRGNKSVIADGFKGYLQYMPSFRRDIVRLATGISVYGISKNNLRDIQVKLPSIHEQVAIAKILYDMDTELSALEQQLAKARNLKQGMMQELLTGRIRLT